MNIGYLMTIAVTAILPVAVCAQAAATAPADPLATVPELRYESVFRDYRQWREPQQSPAKTWRTVNDDLARPAAGKPEMNADMPMPESAMPHQHDSHEGK
jgi:hypothetical protein